MDVDALVAIDVHAHAEISMRDPQPPTVFKKARRNTSSTTTARADDPGDRRVLSRAQDGVRDLLGRRRARARHQARFERGGRGARGRELRRDDSVREHRSRARRGRRARSAPLDPALRRPRLQVPSAVPRVLSERSSRVSAVRGDRGSELPRCSTPGIRAWARACPAAAGSG